MQVYHAIVFSILAVCRAVKIVYFLVHVIDGLGGEGVRRNTKGIVHYDFLLV